MKVQYGAKLNVPVPVVELKLGMPFRLIQPLQANYFDPGENICLRVENVCGDEAGVTVAAVSLNSGRYFTLTADTLVIPVEAQIMVTA